MAWPKIRFDEYDFERLTDAFEQYFRYLANRKLQITFLFTNSGKFIPVLSWGDHDVGEGSSGTAAKFKITIGEDFSPKRVVRHINSLGLEERQRAALQRFFLEDNNLVRGLLRDRKNTFWKAWSRYLFDGHLPKWFERELISQKWNQRLASKGATWENIRIYEAAGVEITLRLLRKVRRVHLSPEAVRKQLQRARTISWHVAI